MLSARFAWFLLFQSLSIFLNNVEARLYGQGIIGGDLADKDQFPYQALIQTTTIGGLCGGAIISEKHILTAAHCVIDKNGFFETIFSVKVGIIDGTQSAENYLVERIYVPWQYTPAGVVQGQRFNVTYDVAVLKLFNKLTLTPESGLRAVNLPRGQLKNNKMAYPSFANRGAILSGYGINIMNVSFDENGKEIENGSSDRKLRFARTTVLTNEECKNMYKNKNKINSAILCAQVQQRGDTSRGACSADSGSPLVFNNTIIGVLGASPYKCNEMKKAATYSRVTFHIKFINNAMKDLNLEKMRVAELSYQYAMIDASENSPDATWKPKY